MARTAQELLRLERVVFLPCAQSPLKFVRPIAGDRFRLQWLRDGLRGQRWAEVSDWEINQKGSSYSVETARHWKELDPRAELYWILGSDQWKTISRWKQFRELGRLVHFLVFSRPDAPQPRRGMKMRAVPVRLDISATEIRSRLKQRLSVTGLVLPSIERQLARSRCFR
ncbi:MAG: hypothetical protein NTZ01_06975 [Verrucomicrobia bacterium]|nr:hypothetical protein [Verrucomicrobiota bacterium]